MIATIAEKKLQRSQRSYENHSPAITAIAASAKVPECIAYAHVHIEKEIDFALFMEEVQKTTVFTTNFQRNIETSTRKSTAGKQLEGNSINVLNMSSLFYMLKNTPHVGVDDSHLRNGANYVVRPRSPRYSFSEGSEHKESINRCDR